MACQISEARQQLRVAAHFTKLLESATPAYRCRLSIWKALGQVEAFGAQLDTVPNEQQGWPQRAMRLIDNEVAEPYITQTAVTQPECS